MSRRTLIAGFGNELRGDDGFGIAVLRELAAGPDDPDIELIEVGTGGIRLAQQLLDGYDRLIIIDAMQEHGQPGTLYVRSVEEIAAAREIDMHTAVPAQALMVARALGSLPARVYLVGCEPEIVDELVMELTPRVRAAVSRAVAAVHELLAREEPEAGTSHPAAAAAGADVHADADAGASIERMDEILELLFWFEGEGFAGGNATLDGMVRFLAQPEAEVRRAVEQLVARGDVLADGAEYRLTEIGRGEAARRFAEEFAPMLAQGHGECSDPDCDCRTSPDGPAACRAHHPHGDH